MFLTKDTEDFNPIITHYFDEVKEINNELIHNIEIDFIVNVDKSKVNVKLMKSILIIQMIL